MSTPNPTKTERIDIRASAPVKQLLHEAARNSHKSVSAFLLDAGIAAAIRALADRRILFLDEERWQAFQQALDRPVQDKPRLKNLVHEPISKPCCDDPKTVQPTTGGEKQPCKRDSSNPPRRPMVTPC